MGFSAFAICLGSSLHGLATIVSECSVPGRVMCSCAWQSESSSNLRQQARIVCKAFPSVCLMACRWRTQLTIALLLVSIPAFGGCFQYKVGLAHEPDHLLSDRAIFTLAFTFVVGVFCPLAPSCLLALLCTQQQQRGLSRLLARLLSGRALSALADVSYEVYLLHPLVSPLCPPRKMTGACVCSAWAQNPS